MVVFALNKANFEEFNAKQAGTVTFDADRLMKILKGVKPDRRNGDGTIKTEGETVTLNFREEQLGIEIGTSEYTDKWTESFFDNEEEDMPQPKLELSTKFKIDIDTFKHVIAKAALAGDYIRISADQEQVLFEAKSSEGILGYERTVSKTQLFELENKEPVKAAYHLGLLINLLDNLPKDTVFINFCYGHKLPAKIETGQFDTLTFYVAPRIEVD